MCAPGASFFAIVSAHRGDVAPVDAYRGQARRAGRVLAGIGGGDAPDASRCGVPVDAARRAISRIEPFDRGLYGGIVGWCNATGDGEWAVTIRCGEIDKHSIRLFTGAGIVEGSDPLEELGETSAKCRTLLAALGMPNEL